MPAIQPGRARYTAYGLIAILIWSTSSAVIRTLSEQMGAFTSGLITGLLGGLFGLALGYKTGEIQQLRKAPKSFWTVCLPLYLIYRISMMLSICTAETRQQVLATGLLRDLWPVATMLFFLILYRSKADWRLELCIALSCLGAVIANLSFHSPRSESASATSLWSCFFALLSSLAWGLYSVFSGKTKGGCAYFAVCMLFSGLLSGAMLLFFPEPYPVVTLRSSMEIIYSSFISIFLATVLWNLSLQKGNALSVICLSNYIPVITVFLSSVIFGVLPTWHVIAGCVCIVIGTLFGQANAFSY